MYCILCQVPRIRTNSAEYASQLLGYFNKVDPCGVLSSLPMRGHFNPGEGGLPAVLPENSHVPTPSEAVAASATTAPSAVIAAASGIAPRDHASVVAEEIAQKTAGGYSSVERAAALKSVKEYVEIRERQAAAATTTTTRPEKAPIGIDAAQVPNLWLAVAHSSTVKSGEVKKVEVDGVPIALWRTATGDVSAVSDVCVHRGASLSRGRVSSDRLICPCEYASMMV